jgi:hypothetical protein
MAASDSRTGGERVVHRIRICGGGLLCGVLIWCVIRSVPQVFGVTMLDPQNPCPDIPPEISQKGTLQEAIAAGPLLE